MSVRRTVRCDAATVTDHNDDDSADERTITAAGPSSSLMPSTSSALPPSSSLRHSSPSSSSSSLSQPSSSSLTHEAGTSRNSHSRQHRSQHHNHGRKRRNSQNPATSSMSTSLNASSSSQMAPASDSSLTNTSASNSSGNTLENNNIPLASVANQFAHDQNRIGLHENDPRAFVSLCLSYKNDGNCEYNGDECSYVHGDVCEMCGHAALHPFNELYKRKHIASCLREHEINMEHSFAIARSRDKACGICLEVVVEKTQSNLFGILSNCGHSFCLECIRKWRTQRNYNLNTVRSCPMCRQSSDFVCPSRFWVEDGEEKERLIADYKLKCGTKACRYFQAGAGVCPFGNKCFYLHALPNGVVTDVGPPPSSLPQYRRHRRRRRTRPSRLDRELAALLLLSASSAFASASMPQQGSQSSNSLSSSTSASLQALIDAAAAASAAASASWSPRSSSVLSSTPLSLNENDENGSSGSGGRGGRGGRSGRSGRSGRGGRDSRDGGDNNGDGENNAENSNNGATRSNNRRRRRRRNIVVEDLDDDFDEIQFDFEGFRFSLRDLMLEIMNDDEMLDFVGLVN